MHLPLHFHTTNSACPHCQFCANKLTLSISYARHRADWTLGMVSDKVVIPKTIKPGKYVVSWRMDCEETARE